MSDHPDSNGPDPAAASSRGHPPGLYLLFIVEMWERFSYYGMRALLVLYLIAATTGANPGRGWAKGDAILLYGWYTGLAYLMPLIGGLLADRFLGTHRSMVIGGLLIALGHIVLATTGFGPLPLSQEGMSTFVGGLALITLGTGFFKPCVSVMVGQLYSQKDPRRDGAYTIFYMGVNLGAFICPFVCGTLGETVGWHWGFGAAAVGMLAGLGTYLVLRERYLKGVGLPPEGASPLAPVVMTAAALLLSAGASYAYQMGLFGAIKDEFAKMMEDPYLRFIPYALGLVALAVAIVFILMQERGYRGPVAVIFIFLIFNAFFWIAYEQAGSTLNVFAQDSTNRNLFGWEVPATWFQSVNAGLILLLAPLFAWLWTALGRRNMNPSQPVKVGLGLLFLGGGYVFIVIGAALNASGALVSMFWLFALYTLHTIGEMCLSPTGLSFVNKVAPKRYIALLVGVFYVANFIANLGGGLIGSYVEQIEHGEVSLPWYYWFRLGGQADYFLLFVIS